MKQKTKLDYRSRCIINRFEELVASMPKTAKLLKYSIDASNSKSPDQTIHIVSYLEGFDGMAGKTWDVEVPNCSELWRNFDQYNLNTTYRLHDGALLDCTGKLVLPFVEDCCERQLDLPFKEEFDDCFTLSRAANKVTFTKPSKVLIKHYDGSIFNYDVNSWRSVLKTITKYAMDYYPEAFTEMVEYDLSRDCTKPITNTLRGKIARQYFKLAPRMYLYQNLSAQDIIKFCKHIIHALSVDPERITVEIRNLRP